jgi:hypothetical protein
MAEENEEKGGFFTKVRNWFKGNGFVIVDEKNGKVADDGLMDKIEASEKGREFMENILPPNPTPTAEASEKETENQTKKTAEEATNQSQEDMGFSQEEMEKMLEAAANKALAAQAAAHEKELAEARAKAAQAEANAAEAKLKAAEAEAKAKEAEGKLEDQMDRKDKSEIDKTLDARNPKPRSSDTNPLGKTEKEKQNFVATIGDLSVDFGRDSDFSSVITPRMLQSIQDIQREAEEIRQSKGQGNHKQG